MKTCVIVIPIYKEIPSISELASFRQCLSVFRFHDIVVITHKSLSISHYLNEARSAKVSLDVEYFEENYFKSVKGYNRLCLTRNFYIRFHQFKYMLIYQLDAWVFEDKLQYWCSLDYDYLGAPIYDDKFNLIGVGNGGFSLRKINYCIRILSRSKYLPYVTPSYLINYYKKVYERNTKKNIKHIISYTLKIVLKSLGLKNSIGYFSNSKSEVNEDWIFSVMAKQAWRVNANIPAYHESIKFAFERFPSILYAENNKRLPFGCHAFEKWEYNEFWSKYIKY